jgi:membrane protease YdiL (CAAX protease family)
MHPKQDMRKYKLLTFLLFTFIWSWGFNIPRVFASRGLLIMNPVISVSLGNLAVLGPAVIAFILVRRDRGKEAARNHWRRGWRLGAPKKWLLPAIFIMPLLTLIGAGIYVLLGNQIQWQYSVPPAMIFPVFTLIYLFGALPEEYGWRGYALEGFLQKWNPLVASLILGAIWSLWHLPLHLIEGTTQSAIPIWQFMIQNTLYAFLYTWLYKQTNHSILVVTLLHAFGNISNAIMPTWVDNPGRWIAFGVLLVATVLVWTVWPLREEKTVSVPAG